MTIKIVCVGKIKESYFKDAIAEYSKRLSRFCKLEIVEVNEEFFIGNGEKQLEIVKHEECRRLFEKCEGYVIAMDIKGKELSSEEIAQKLEDLTVDGNSTITFVIGGSYGFEREVLADVDFKLSFGKVTYPHQLMRVILLEQIYRAFMIREGSSYHK